MRSKHIICVLGAMAIFFIATSCHREPDLVQMPHIDSPLTTMPDTPILNQNTIDPAEEKEIIEECTKVVVSYANIYRNASKEKDMSLPVLGDSERLILVSDDYNKIWDFLYQNGVPILKEPNDEYTAMIDSESFLEFWNSVERGEVATFDTFSLSKDGGLFYRRFCNTKEEKYCVEVSMGWSDNTASMIHIQKEPLAFWDYTGKGNFLYEKSYAPPWMGSGHGLIHIGPYNEEMVSISQKYVSSVGYHGNNLFLSNWSEEDWGDLNFNDLFEYLYQAKYNIPFDSYSYEYDPGTSWCYLEKTLFESVIDTYFDVPKNVLQTQTLYDELRGGYPWRPSMCSDYTVNGDMVPDIRAYAEHDDGTATMEIDVLCPYIRTDCLFTHRLTVRPLPNGGFQYVSNEIITPSEGIFPQYYPRIEEQRQEQYSQ